MAKILSNIPFLCCDVCRPKRLKTDRAIKARQMMHQAREGGIKRGEKEMRRRWRAEADTARRGSTNTGVSSADVAAVWWTGGAG